MYMGPYEANMLGCSTRLLFTTFVDHPSPPVKGWKWKKKPQQFGPYLEGCWMEKEPYEANMLGHSIRLISVVHTDGTVVDYQ